MGLLLVDLVKKFPHHNFALASAIKNGLSRMVGYYTRVASLCFNMW
jgi:hypothetical protein